MGDTLVMICYGLLGALLLFVLTDIIRSRVWKHLKADSVLLVLTLLGWVAAEICFYLTQTPQSAVRARALYLPFAAFASMALLLYVIQFYCLDAYHTPVVIILLCSVPLITAVLALTVHRHDFLWSGLEVALSPRHTATGQREIWFWIHAAYCHVLLCVSLALAAVQSRRAPDLYRAGSRWLMLGIGITELCNLLQLFQVLPLQLDLALMGAGACVAILHFTDRDNQDLRFLGQIRREAYHQIGKAVFVLDNEDDIVNRNQAAARVLEKSGVDPASVYYRIVMGRALRGAKAKKNSDSDGGVDYYYPAGLPGSVLNVQEKTILDRRGKLIGAIAIWTDVTENREMMRRLEVDGGIDAITGLYNRNKMDQHLLDLDREKNFPLAVMMGDLNNLKLVNDIKGHQQGDIALRTVAEGLRFCCPPKSRICRMGGDEFLVLIPRCPRWEAHGIQRELDQHFASIFVDSPVSLALGVCIKERPDQSLQEVLKWADQRMYQDKRRKKSQPPRVERVI